MPLVCPSCRTENPDIARFCLACGTRLAGTEIGRERKYVALLFADLVGSTALGEREDPEVVQTLVTSMFARLAEAIVRFGGTIDKIMGDAILALFGVPIAHEDDPERAIRAALEMQQLVRTMAAETTGPILEMRIGVEAGEVMVNLEPPPGLPDRMVTGDAANTAARLQSAAAPGTVVVGPAAHSATSTTFDYQPLPPLDLKGKAEPLHAWVAVGLRGAPGERPDGGLATAPFVGRDDELEILLRTFDRVAGQRRPAFVTVVGGAGIGKSRIAAEFGSRLDHSDPTRESIWIRGRCLAYGNPPYSAFAEAVRDHCDASSPHDPSDLRSKIRASATDAIGTEVVEAIVALLGADPSRPSSREDLFDGWRRYLQMVASQQNVVVLVLEDIHWADEGLIAFLDHLSDWGEGPILVLTLARPEFLEAHPGWGGGKQRYTAITLEPLDLADCATLAASLLDGEPSERLEAFITDRTGGNPLFAEELLKALVEGGAAQRRPDGSWDLVGDGQVSLPRSVHGVVASRIDHLDPREKSVLVNASAIGRVFWLGCLSAISGMGTDSLRRTTDPLRLKELLVEHDPPSLAGELELAFRHVVIRDVAYESLPKARRASLHAEIAEWFSALDSSPGSRHAEHIASHYGQAARYLRELGDLGPELTGSERGVLRWAQTAGERAERLKDLSEAARWFQRAVDAARRVDTGSAELAAVLERLGDIQFPAGALAEAEDVYREAMALRSDLGDQSSTARIKAKLAFSLWYAGRLDEVWELIQEAVATLEPLGDSADLALALVIYGTSLVLFRHQDGLPHLERAVAMAGAAGDRVTEAQGAVFLGHLLVLGGEPQRGIRVLEESVELARGAGDAESTLMALGLLADGINTYGETPSPDRVDALIGEAVVLARKGRRHLRLERTLDSAAWTSFQRGRLAECGAALAEQLEICRQNALPFEGPVLLFQSWLAALTGRHDDAERLFTEGAAKTPFPTLRLPVASGWVSTLRGDVEEAAETFLAAARAGYDQSYEAGVEYEYLLLDAIRTGLAAGREADAREVLTTLSDLASTRPSARPFARWADGLLAESAEGATSALTHAAQLLETRHQFLDRGRVLLDLAATERRAGGEEWRGTLADAQRILADCGAVIDALEQP